MLYIFKGCKKCGGDLTLSFDEWGCFQCGNRYYPKSSAAKLLLEPVDLKQPVSAGGSLEHANPEGGRRKIRRSARHLNPVLANTRFNEEQWWIKNQKVIRHLDEGLKVREISEIVGQGPRQIRVIRERLRDLRSIVPELTAAD